MICQRFLMWDECLLDTLIGTLLVYDFIRLEGQCANCDAWCKAKILVVHLLTSSMEIHTLLHDVASPALGSKNVKVEYCRQKECWTRFVQLGNCNNNVRCLEWAWPLEGRSTGSQ